MQSFTDLVKDTRELVSLSARGQQLSLADQRSHSFIFGDCRRHPPRPQVFSLWLTTLNLTLVGIAAQLPVSL